MNPVARQFSRESIAFMGALGLHLCLALFLFLDPHGHERPVLTQETHNTAGDPLAADKPTRTTEVVKAMAVDQRQVTEEIERLKQTKLAQKKQEIAQQQALQRQVEAAKAARVAEQKRLEALKAEDARLALARKKAAEDAKKRLKAMANEKIQAQQALETLKLKQKMLQQQAQKVLKAQQQAQQKQQKLNDAKAAEAAASLAAEKAAVDAAERARLAGVVDKYKASILNAISRQWILPEHVQAGLSSQFRIRLAASGEVLAVNLTRSSGDPILDRSAQTAIYKASPLPVPADAVTFNLFREIHLTVRPENLRGQL